jgi:Ca-activated chloride channel family protein
MRQVGLRLGALLGALGAVTLGACSSDDAGGDGGYDLPGEDAGSGSGGPSGSSGTGPGSGAGGGGNPYIPDPDPIDAPPPEDAECDALDSSKPAILYLSADDSNSMASPIIARELIEQGFDPNIPIRTYEFLNYYHLGYAPAPAGQLSILPELAAREEPGVLDFQIGVRAFDPPAKRRPMTLTFVLDTSGSMEGAGLEREQAAIRAIAGNLAEGDIVNMTTWNTEDLVVMSGHVATGPDDAEILAAADLLAAGGGTDLDGGLEAGYQLAKQHFGADRLNRVILISDGGANVGETNGQVIGQSSEDADQEGIYLVGVHTGPAVGFADETLMNAVTDLGRGAYVYLDSPQEAARVLGKRFDEVMDVAARGVQVELTMPWYFQMHEFYGEEFSENPEEIEPQHLAPGDAMVLSQVLKACDASKIVGSDAVRIRATWTEPLTYAPREAIVETTVQALLSAGTPHLPKAKAIVAYAEGLKVGDATKLQAALDLIAAADPDDSDPELKEIKSLIALHPAMQ